VAKGNSQEKVNQNQNNKEKIKYYGSKETGLQITAG